MKKLIQLLICLPFLTFSQNIDHWETAIFDNDTWKQLRSNEDLPLQLAAELGLDIEQLNKDMQDPTLDAQIQREYEELRSLGNSYETDTYAGVRLAVPKFFINGREPEGRSVDAWSKVIEEELKK